MATSPTPGPVYRSVGFQSLPLQMFFVLTQVQQGGDTWAVRSPNFPSPLTLHKAIAQASESDLSFI